MSKAHWTLPENRWNRDWTASAFLLNSSAYAARARPFSDSSHMPRWYGAVSTAAYSSDFAFDLKAERRRRIRRFLRVAVPIATLLILLAAIGGIGIYLYQANRADARLLTDDLLEELEQRIVSEIVNFLEPASVMVRLTREVLKDQALGGRREGMTEPLSMHILASNPQLSTFSFADPQGDFLMLKKWPDGSIHTKFMQRHGEKVDSTWVHRDTAGKVLGVEHDPADTYDPRTRPWYTGAVSTGKLYWSDVYVFFTDRRPGITASLPVYDSSGELAAVYSVDIALEHLSTFLGSLEIGRSGRAMIIDNQGYLVAYPVMEKMLKVSSGELERVHIEDLADPVLNRSFDEFRVSGPGKRLLTVDGYRFISTATSLESTLGRAWTLLLVAPEEDFVGFVADNNRRGLYMSVAVLGLASLLAGLLIFQGLRADRNAQLVFERQNQLAGQSRAFADLASEAALFDRDNQSAVAALTETVAGTVGARRISVWHFVGGDRLVCDDVFDTETDGHTTGMQLIEDEMPQFFQALQQNSDIITGDAAADPRTAELHRIYLHPLGCRALASLPIVRDGQTLGAIWLEDDAKKPEQISGDVAFTRAVANMLALRMRAGEGEAAGSPRDRASQRAAKEQHVLSEPMRRTELATGHRGEAFLSRVSRTHGDGGAVGAQIFKDVSVVVMQFTDPISLAASVDGDDHSAAGDLVQKLETLAAERGVEYLKLLGDQIVCAAGFSGEADSAAELVADFALGALDHCVRLSMRLEQPLGVRIGIDSGPVIGSAVGRDRSVFNIWGEAVLTAARMAESAIPGQIQATESIYARIRDSFLFRVRGSYYLEGFGEFTTYTLTGRL